MPLRPTSTLAERALLAALVLSAGRLAAATVAPVVRPLARAECPAAAARVAATERAFAAAARAGGPAIRAAFLTYIADSGAVLAGPGLVRRAELERSPVRPGLLLWRPAFVFASGAGDLGFSTGPSESHPGDGSGRVGHGHYATIWARQPDGTFRFLVDVGTQHDAPAAGMPRATDPAPAAEPPLAGALACPPAPDAAPPATVAAALAADSAYAAAAAGSWRAGARHHAPDVRLHRTGRYPLTGVAAADSLAAWDAPLAARALGHGVARSGDFAWTRGTYALGPADAPAESGAFLRVWRVQPDGAWRLAVEIISPAPPPRRADARQGQRH
jgi:ketosteroid isomerase-like protein